MPTKNSPTISALILTKNETSMIEGCLECLQWCDEIIVLDQNSNDDTVKRAKAAGAQVHQVNSSSFARRRNELLSLTKSDWALYIDADERVSPELAKAIVTAIDTAQFTAYQLNRANYYFGQLFHHGGWYPDQIIRLVKKSAAPVWTGDIHETLEVTGEVGLLEPSLMHLSHRTILDGLQKSAEWTPVEAHLLAENGIAPVTWLTVLRKMVGEFWRRAVVRGGWRDGNPGMLEAVVQAINRALVYLQVWEQQRQPPLSEIYSQLDAQVRSSWKTKRQ